MSPTATSPLRPSWSQLEATLEAYFALQVRKRLLGRSVKLAPTEKGCPDRMVLLPGGRTMLVELKADRGRLSAAQEHWHDRARGLGVRVDVLRGKTDVDAWILARAEEFATSTRKKKKVTS